MKKDVGYSINQCDDAGESFDDCVLIHIDTNTIIRFNNLKELVCFRDSITTCINQIADRVVE